jgi:hypothetical protein
MEIYALIQGWYGERIIQNMLKRLPKGWTIKSHRLPDQLPIIIDEPGNFLPKETSRFDLILSLGEHPSVAYLLPSIVKATSAKAVIAPIDDSRWLPPGVKRQISEELTRLGVAAAFPKVFCSLTPIYKNDLIDEFARYFGRHKLQITLNNDVIESVHVIRGSPCGSTHYIADKLRGLEISEAPREASLQLQIYPCLASQDKDLEYGTPLMHVAAHIVMGEVKKALCKAKGSTPLIPSP